MTHTAYSAWQLQGHAMIQSLHVQAPLLIRSALTDVWDEDKSSQSAIQQKRKLKHQLRLRQAFDRAFSILTEAASSVTLTSGGQIGKTHANFKQSATTGETDRQ